MRAPLSSRPVRTRAPSGPATGHLLAAGACALLAAALLLLLALDWAPLLTLDHTVGDALHRSAVDNPGWTRLNRTLTDWPWDPWAMRLLLLLAAALLARRGDRTTAMWVLFVLLTGSAAQQGMKAAVGRERPRWPDPVDSAHYAAFPSGHAMTAAFACVVLVWLLRRAGAGAWWRAAMALAVVSVLGVGFTRVYLGVHWVSDVLGGWLLGVVVASGSIAGYERWQRAASRKPLNEPEPPGNDR
ncbi:MAG TPA: hypothetical protein DEQ61_01970 [Streptomyces sp.]|nr:hypothetical protein [Streptomyces sp.]